MRKLPPLSAIRVFEAAARHEHFTAAADELGMTQAAVSYQIRALEERVGVKLFERSKGRVRLTETGRRLLAPLTAAFDRMDGAFAALRADDENMLSISTTSTFANTWLAWRIGGFQMDHPELAVRLDANNSLIDFASSDVDVAIRAGMGDWPGLHAQRLFEIDFTPICSPKFLAD
jgi:LysR family glycine cleavage system transcriptional activator